LVITGFQVLPLSPLRQTAPFSVKTKTVCEERKERKEGVRVRVEKREMKEEKEEGGRGREESDLIIGPLNVIQRTVNRFLRRGEKAKREDKRRREREMKI
jgi:hypothetical protein